jgi:integrase
MPGRADEKGLFLRGRRWWLAVYDKTLKRKRNIAMKPAGESKATTNILVARVLAAQVRRELAQAGPGAAARQDASLSALVEDFKAVNASESTEAQAKDNAGHVTAFLSEFDLVSEAGRVRRHVPAARGPGQITTERVQDWVVHLKEAGRSPKTAWNHKASISRFCEYLIGRGYMAANPCRRVKVKKSAKLLPRFLSADEHEQALTLAKEHRIYPEVATALYTGMRREELRRMAWADVDFTRAVVMVPKSKSRRPRMIPMSEKLRAVLLEQQADTGRRKHVFPGRARRDHTGMRRGSWWVDALKPLQTTMPIFTADMADTATGRGWHLFRHTFASRLVQAGVPIAKVSAWLGHSDIRTTMIYAHLAPGHDKDIEHA